MDQTELNILNRDYKQKPLKHGEKLTKEQLEYLFIEMNYSSKQIAKIINKNRQTVLNWCKEYGLSKTKEQIKQARKNTMLERYGVDNAMKSKQLKQKYADSVLENYGVEHPAQNSLIKEKMKQTYLEKYNVENPMLSEKVKETMKQNNLKEKGVEWNTQTKEMREKSKQTCLEKYGVENPAQNEEVKRKMKNTCLQKYGVCHPMKLPENVKQLKQTMQELYGKDNALKVDSIRQKVNGTCQQKYGNDWVMGSQDFKQKSKNTCLEKYGVDNPSKYPDVINKIKETSCEALEKAKQTNLERYGVEHPMQLSLQVSTEQYERLLQIRQKIKDKLPQTLRKQYETKKKNNSFNKSKPEEQIYAKLSEKFDVIRQYKSEQYPFACDFYIPSLDLYIEFKGSWTHGGCIYENNEQCDKQLEDWKEKAKTSKFYENAIYSWTDLDVRKIEYVKKNNLNYLEFYSLEEFLLWMDEIDGN